MTDLEKDLATHLVKQQTEAMIRVMELTSTPLEAFTVALAATRASVKATAGLLSQNNRRSLAEADVCDEQINLLAAMLEVELKNRLRERVK